MSAEASTETVKNYKREHDIAAEIYGTNVQSNPDKVWSQRFYKQLRMQIVRAGKELKKFCPNKYRTKDQYKN